MTETLKAKIARRPFLAATLAVLGFAATGGAAYETGLFGPHYPKTPYDDLLYALPDRANAVVLGKAVLAENPAFDAGKTAAALRKTMAKTGLSGASARDISRGRMIEVRGWLVPATLVELSALAAYAASSAVTAGISPRSELPR